MKSKLLLIVLMIVVFAEPAFSQVIQGGNHRAVAAGHEYVAIY